MAALWRTPADANTKVPRDPSLCPGSTRGSRGRGQHTPVAQLELVSGVKRPGKRGSAGPTQRPAGRSENTRGFILYRKKNSPVLIVLHLWQAKAERGGKGRQRREALQVIRTHDGRHDGTLPLPVYGNPGR